MTAPVSGRLAEGVHTVEVEGVAIRYHVHGTGPVCVAHPGGPGIAWDYLRAPVLEQHLTMVYVEPAGTGASGRLRTHPDGYTRARYSRHLAALIDYLRVPRVHLLGHSYGGFVAQYHALRRPGQLAGLVLYESAAVTGPEFGAEAARQVGEFAARHAGHPDLPRVLEAFAAIPAIDGDEAMVAAVRGVLPAYVAGYWSDPGRWAPLGAALQATYISGRDERGEPDVIDDRARLGALELPTLVVVGRFDVVCGVRWAEELHRLIRGSQLLILENSGHLGHLEEPALFADGVATFVIGVSDA